MHDLAQAITCNAALTGRDGGVAALARRALCELAESRRPTELDPLKNLCRSYVDPDDRARHAVVARLIAQGVTSEELVERYIPKVARMLGEGWVDDTLTFSQVTLGAARLQETVRAFSHRPRAGAVIPLGHRMLLVIPEQEDHSLGAFVAAGQFRKYGIWVQLSIGKNCDEVAEAVRAEKYDLVGVTGAGRRSLAPIREIVTRLRGTDGTPPIVVGGNVCNIGVDVCASTGADLATTRPRTALDFCGLLMNMSRSVAVGEAS
jgi:MerR family transcriptional regulator, light-induced transcriptional regulator